MHNIKVSVIITTYNRPELLRRAIKSVIGQTFKLLDIIVVDDCGHIDNSLVVSEFSDVRYIKHVMNKGLSAARNTGISNAIGNFICFLDDDDVFLSNHLEVLLRQIISLNLNGVYSDCYDVNYCDNVEVSRTYRHCFDFDKNRLLIHNFAPPVCFLFRKSIFDNIDLFDCELSSHEDWDMWIRLSRYHTLKHIPIVTCEYSVDLDKKNMSSNRQNMKETYLKTILKTRAYITDENIIRMQNSFYEGII